MTGYRCTALTARGRQCANKAEQGRTTCKRHHDHGQDIVVLPSRKHRGIAGWGTRQRADRPPTAIG